GLSLHDAVVFGIEKFRNTLDQFLQLDISFPVYITENGFPDKINVTESDQALAIETILDTILEVKTKYNIGMYSFFNLRDTNESKTGFGTNESLGFGLLRCDYSKKPSFNVFKEKI